MKNFKIRGIKGSIKFSESATIVLKRKLEIVVDELEKYKSLESPENLHGLRIALRRFRYNLEIYYCCFGKHNFTTIYKIVCKTLDVLGNIRDVDVMNEKAKEIENELNIFIPSVFFENIESKKIESRNNLDKHLRKLMKNKEIQKLMKE